MIDPHGERRQAGDLFDAHIGCSIDAAQLELRSGRDRLQDVEVIAEYHYSQPVRTPRSAR
ncbi:MAG: hypothetical protein R3F10_05900 [Lysobacteraceae bacterium]